MLCAGDGLLSSAAADKPAWTGGPAMRLQSSWDIWFHFVDASMYVHTRTTNLASPKKASYQIPPSVHKVVPVAVLLNSNSTSQ